MKTTAEVTKIYVDKHPHIKNCLKKGLINYSALARYISEKLNIQKSSSKEAILIAARRIEEQLKKEFSQEKKLIKLLSESEIELKTKIVVFILEKNVSFSIIEDIQKKIKTEYGYSVILEGSDAYTLITQEKFSKLIEQKTKKKIIKLNKNLVSINIKSSKGIETTQGIIAYLTALFAENGVNIVEFLSCWTDTTFIINAKDFTTAMNFLNFR